MNIIFNDSNTNIGGIEVLFLEMTQYLTNSGHKVFYIVRDSNSIYEKSLYDNNRVFFIRKKQNKPVELYSNHDLKLEKKFIISQFPEN